MEAWGIETTATVATDGLRFETVEYLPGHWAERHAHGIAYADLMLSGAQEARWEGADVCRTPGTLALMPVGEAHATASVRPTRTFQIAISPAWAGGATGRCAHFDVGPLAWRVTRMWREFRHRDDLTPAVLEGRLLHLLDALQNDVPPTEGRNPRWLRQAQEYAHAHARNGFSTADVAREVGVAPAHLMRSYADRYGVTLGDDARRWRVADACRRLVKRDESLGDIAFTSGFADQSHLNRVFKRHTGLTPREYRDMAIGHKRSFPSKT